jgi:hypothetical protein
MPAKITDHQPRRGGAQGPGGATPGQVQSFASRLRSLFDGRPSWVSALMVFCGYMAFIYVPWDLFVKPLDVDEEVWFGIRFTGWAAKIAAIPHWGVYAAGFFGFWRMSSWMWPWAAVYTAQVAVGMLVWCLLEYDGGRAWLAGVASFIPFAALTYALWNARTRFRRSA